jgi:Icc-related predicted phosphoesterase
MAKTLIYFVSDLHGSSVCFRKFINASKVYKPKVMVLGGDVAGKAIQSIVHAPNGRWTCTFIGVDYDLEDGAELVALEKLIADHGYYPYRAEPGELEAMEQDGTIDELFLRLMRERLAEWLQIADERLRPLGVPLYLMLGNDDPPQLRQMLIDAPWGQHAEGEILWIDDEHEMLSWGYPNTTPWHTYREQTEEQLAKTLAQLSDKLTRPERAIFNVHAPPYDTQLDDAPKLNERMEVQASLGTVIMAPVGSTAVRQAMLDRQPLLGLHGHIHESSGIRRLGRSMVINPGSDYSTGALMGALVTVSGEKVTGHQLVRG